MRKSTNDEEQIQLRGNLVELAQVLNMNIAATRRLSLLVD